MAVPKPTIAVVENDGATSVALGRLLRAQGFSVDCFDSGEAFLAREGGRWPDCLLLDINLGAMSGLDLQREIRAAGIGVPIIFMTGQHEARTELCAHRQGCSGYLQKPFAARVLSRAIAGALRQGEAPGWKSD